MPKPRKTGWDPLIRQQDTTDPEIIAAARFFVYRVETPIVRYAAWGNRLYNIGVIWFADRSAHISFKRNDRSAVRDWRHFQAIKNEVAGPEREAIEIFPPESNLVDGANQYHLWVLPEGAQSPLGLIGRAVDDGTALPEIDYAQHRTRLRAGQPSRAPGTRQRPWEPGIPTGLGRDRA